MLHSGCRSVHFARSLRLEALASQGTTTAEEFAAGTFATDTRDEWTSDDHVTRIANDYHYVGGSPQPAYEWLYGGDLQCPTVMHASWQTIGAQQYPDSPLMLEGATYQGTVATEHAISATGGSDPVTIVVPTGERAC